MVLCPGEEDSKLMVMWERWHPKSTQCPVLLQPVYNVYLHHIAKGVGAGIQLLSRVAGNSPDPLSSTDHTGEDVASLDPELSRGSANSQIMALWASVHFCAETQ